MKKSAMMKITAVALTIATMISPVNVQAAEERVYNYEDICAYYAENWNEQDCRKAGYDENGDSIYEKAYDEGYYDFVASMNGGYTEDGVQIVTALNGKTKKIKKTGTYQIVVGGKTAKKDEGTVKFVAPKSGTYKFTLSVESSITHQDVYVEPYDSDVNPNFKTKYSTQSVSGKKMYTTDWSCLLLAYDGSCSRPKSDTYLDGMGDISSEMRTISGSVKLKKGQKVVLTARNCNASYGEDTAYRFADYTLTIKKTK